MKRRELIKLGSAILGSASLGAVAGYGVNSAINNKDREIKTSNNKLIIEPEPDSLLRLTMHVKKVNKEVNINEQNLPTFERKGFVAVEWGGIVY